MLYYTKYVLEMNVQDGWYGKEMHGQMRNA